MAIGGTSALVHLFLVFNLVNFLQIPPLVANIIAFFIAFNVSFLGHKYLTFSQMHNQTRLSLPHFFAVSSSAGLMNEMLYFLFLRYTSLNYMVALLMVLGLMAIYTFILSRFWACR